MFIQASHPQPASQQDNYPFPSSHARRCLRPRPGLPQHFAFKTLTSADFRAYFTEYFQADCPAVKGVDWCAPFGKAPPRRQR